MWIVVGIAVVGVVLLVAFNPGYTVRRSGAPGESERMIDHDPNKDLPGETSVYGHPEEGD